MSKERLQSLVGPPKRKTILADGREEWFYDTQEKKMTHETISNSTYVYPGTAPGTEFQWDGDETTSSIEFSAKIKTTERPVSISPSGKVEGIPNGKIVENR